MPGLRLTIHIGGTGQQSNCFGGRHRFVQKLKALFSNLGGKTGDAREIAARTIKARHQAKLDRISARRKNYWYVPRRRFGSQCRRSASCSDQRWPSAYQISGKRRQPFVIALRGAVLNRHVVVL